MEPTNLKEGLTWIVEQLVDRGITLSQARKEFERQFIIASLRSNQGNVGSSARSIGVHRNTLHNKISSLGIQLDEHLPNRTKRQRSPRTR